eukprot:1012397-Amphidinium_carterae.1
MPLEKLRRDQEELDRQAARTEIPEEQVQVAEQVLRVPPLIGEREENGDHSEPQTIESSTTTSDSTRASTRVYRQER